jgi:hypothetical protein
MVPRSGAICESGWADTPSTEASHKSEIGREIFTIKSMLGRIRGLAGGRGRRRRKRLHRRGKTQRRDHAHGGRVVRSLGAAVGRGCKVFEQHLWRDDSIRPRRRRRVIHKSPGDKLQRRPIGGGAGQGRVVGRLGSIRRRGGHRRCRKRNERGRRKVRRKKRRRKRGVDMFDNWRKLLAKTQGQGTCARQIARIRPDGRDSHDPCHRREQLVNVSKHEYSFPAGYIGFWRQNLSKNRPQISPRRTGDSASL